MNNLKNNKLLKEAIMLLLNEQILLEVKNKKFKRDVVNTNIISKELYNSKIFNKKKGKLKKPFKDTLYYQMLYNSAFYYNDLDTQNFGRKFTEDELNEFIGMYDKVKEKIIDPYHRGEIEYNEVTFSDDPLEPSTCEVEELSYYTLKKFLEREERNSVSSKDLADFLDSIDYNVLSRNRDFDILKNDSEFITFKPKSLKGSIALGRSYWCSETNKLKYDITFNKKTSGYGSKCGTMQWCTTILSEDGDNHFITYTSDGLDLYYLVKKKYNVNDPYRKVCIGVPRSGMLMSGSYADNDDDSESARFLNFYLREEGAHTNVDANNDPLYDFKNLSTIQEVHEEISMVIGKARLKFLLNKSDVTEEIDIEESDANIDNLKLYFNGFLEDKNSSDLNATVAILNYMLNSSEKNSAIVTIIKLIQDLNYNNLSKSVLTLTAKCIGAILISLDGVNLEKVFIYLVKLFDQKIGKLKDAIYTSDSVKGQVLEVVNELVKVIVKDKSKNITNKLFYQMFIQYDWYYCKKVIVDYFINDQRATADMLFMILQDINRYVPNTTGRLDVVKKLLMHKNCDENLLIYIVENHHVIGDYYRENPQEDKFIDRSGSFNPGNYLGEEREDITKLIKNSSAYTNKVKSLFLRNTLSIPGNFARGLEAIIPSGKM